MTTRDEFVAAYMGRMEARHGASDAARRLFERRVIALPDD